MTDMQDLIDLHEDEMKKLRSNPQLSTDPHTPDWLAELLPVVNSEAWTPIERFLYSARELFILDKRNPEKAKDKTKNEALQKFVESLITLRCEPYTPPQPEPQPEPEPTPEPTPETPKEQ